MSKSRHLPPLYFILSALYELAGVNKFRAECLSPLLCLNLCTEYACNDTSVYKPCVDIRILYINIYSYTHMHLIFVSEEAEQLSEA